jgi:hypothetical protein
MSVYDSLHLDSDERVILEVRRHWIVFFGHAIAVLVGACLPFVLFIIAKTFFSVVFTFSIPGNGHALFTFLYCLWLLVLWISFFLNWTKYYLDVWYVTEKRIIAINQRSTFNREVSNLRFDKIQDVTINVHGVIATFLGFGDVRVQTASEDERDFFLRFVRHPDEVRRIIFNQHNTVHDVSRANSV